MTGLPENSPEVYTVVMRDKSFMLSKSQIERDYPNFFTSHFFDSSGQCTTRTLEISRDPFLFELILRYLNGYQVTPIHPSMVPPHSTPKSALADLLVDAKFYHLGGLADLLTREIAQPVSTTHFATITGYFTTLPLDFAPCEYELE
jgi:hypothetical protein